MTDRKAHAAGATPSWAVGLQNEELQQTKPGTVPTEPVFAAELQCSAYSRNMGQG